MVQNEQKLDEIRLSRVQSRVGRCEIDEGVGAENSFAPTPSSISHLPARDWTWNNRISSIQCGLPVTWTTGSQLFPGLEILFFLNSGIPEWKCIPHQNKYLYIRLVTEACSNTVENRVLPRIKSKVTGDTFIVDGTQALKWEPHFFLFVHLELNIMSIFIT